MKYYKVFQILLLMGAQFLTLNFAVGQGTAFTYQGRLSDYTSGSPLNGRYDFQFLVYDSPTAGTQLGSTLQVNFVEVRDGLFTVNLDFGPGMFTGPGRWLQILVSTNGGGFSTLTPRQSLSAVPYAVMAGNLTGTIPTSQLSGTISSNQIAPATDAVYRDRSNQVPVINVRDYGAMGNTADDSAALRAAFQAWTNRGGILYFPSGRYRDTNNYYIFGHGGHTKGIYYPLTLAGESKASTFWEAAITDSTFIVSRLCTPMIRDITIENVGPGVNNGFTLTNDSGPTTWYNVRFRGWTGVGANLAASAGGNIYAATFEDCRVGLKLPGYCDGWRVDLRSDRNFVGVDIAGHAPGFPGIHRAQAVQIQIVGNRNHYGVVAGQGWGHQISGYMENCFVAAVAIGHPPGVGDPDLYVGSVLIQNFAFLAYDTQVVARIYAPVSHLALKNIGCGGPMVVSTRPEYDTTPVVFEGTQASELFRFSDGTSVLGNWGQASSAQVNHDSPIYWRSNLTHRFLPNQTFIRGQLQLNNGSMQQGALNVARSPANENWALYMTDTTNAAANKTARIGMMSHAGDSVPQTMIMGSQAGVSDSTLYYGGGTTLGRPFSGHEFRVGNPGSVGPGNPVLNLYSDSSVRIGTNANAGFASGGAGSLTVDGRMSASTFIATGIKVTTTNYFADLSDDTIIMKEAYLTVTLPNAIGSKGKSFTIVQGFDGMAFVSASNAQLINSENTYVLEGKYKFVKVVSDDSQWWITGSGPN